MKKLLMLSLALALICSLSGCNRSEAGSDANSSAPPITEPQTRKLTLDKLMELAKKGENLSWSDFEPYGHEDIGSGLYIYRYAVDEKYYLLIGGTDLQVSPLYIQLVSSADDKDFIDIRTESIDDFLHADRKE